MGKRKDYYSILGVPTGASGEEIKSAYRRLARRFHPDMEGASDAERFRDIQEAYETLASPDKRRAYDLTRGDEIPIRHGSMSGPGAVPWFEPATPSRPRRWGRRAGALAADAEIVLSPEEARQGGTLSFEVRVGEACGACDGTGQGFTVWCWDCDGTGEVRRYRRVSFSIPPGVEHGATLSASLGPARGHLRARVLISQSY
jgi:molecular chaperone DnaJ